jgi:hypothetical protein
MRLEGWGGPMVRDAPEFTIGPRFARTGWALLTMRPREVGAISSADYAEFTLRPREARTRGLIRPTGLKRSGTKFQPSISKLSFAP